MKKLLFIMVALCMATTIDAQVYVGGGIGFTRTTEALNKSTIFRLMPEAGYRINDRWAIGLSLGYANSKNSTEVSGMESELKLTQYNFNPYARYTFAKLDKVGLFVDGGVEYIHRDIKGSYDTNAWNIGLRPGISFTVNDKISLVAHVGFLGYRTQKSDFEGAIATNTFTADIDGNDLSFSVYYNF